MLKFNSLLKLINKNIKKQTCRRYGNANIKAITYNNLSTRDKNRNSSTELYKEHNKILYSSHLELENLNNIKMQWFDTKKNNKLKLNLEQRGSKVETTKQVPKNWMDDYEFYEGAVDEAGNINSTYGTSDLAIPPSNVPCNGCGAHLHCASIALPGYIPKEIFQGRTTAELKTIICQRCHFLKEYNIALDVEVTPETYIDTISRIKNEYALAIIIVDLLDCPSSIWPDMQNILGSKRPVFIVGNKVDLLPRDSNSYLQHIKQCLQEQIKAYGGFDAMNIKYVSLISAKTGYGIEELITQLQKIWLHKGDVYLMGCTNVGKSSLFNILLNSDYCRPEATDLVRKATTCPWPGTTLQMLKFPILRPSELRIYQRFRRLFSERGKRAAEAQLRRDQAQKTNSIQAAKLIGNVGRTFDSRTEVADAFSASTGTKPIITLNEKSLEYQKARWCYDTPGVMHPAQMTNLLTTDELLKLQPQQMIIPRAFRLKHGTSIFLAGLGRLDFVNYKPDIPVDWVKIFVFSSLKLPVTIVAIEDANQVYRDYLNTEIIGLPFGSEERLKRWPNLTCQSDEIIVQGNQKENVLSCDITLSSAGWIGISVPKGAQCGFKAWTPNARGIFVRKPALIPYADRLVGKRIRNSLAYNLSRPFVFKK